MPADLSTIDLATINVGPDVIVAALRNKCCKWGQDSSDAVADACLTNALMRKRWAFAADVLASKVSGKFSGLFSQTFTARFSDLSTTTHRSAADQVLDAVALEVAAAQKTNKLVAV